MINQKSMASCRVLNCGYFGTSPRLGVIFDMISVKAPWEQWCRWNCDLTVINARKRHFLSYWKRHHDAQITWTTSLWGVAAKWPNRSPKTKLILCPRDPQGYSRQAWFWKSTGTSALKQTQRGIPWGLQNRTHWSARYTNGHHAVQQESQLVWSV